MCVGMLACGHPLLAPCARVSLRPVPFRPGKLVLARRQFQTEFKVPSRTVLLARTAELVCRAEPAEFKDNDTVVEQEGPPSQGDGTLNSLRTADVQVVAELDQDDIRESDTESVALATNQTAIDVEVVDESPGSSAPGVAHKVQHKAAVEDSEPSPPRGGYAILRFARGSPLKVRRVLNTIRGQTYQDAIMMLEYMPYRACEPILSTLLSAAANAANNNGADKNKLFVAETFANNGPVLKRMMARARGRADQIRKPTFHLTIRVQEMDVAQMRALKNKKKKGKRRGRRQPEKKSTAKQ